VVALLTTVSEDDGQVAIHGVRREVLRAQADAVGLPLVEVPLPTPCPNAAYEARMAAALAGLRQVGVEDAIFGDIHLADVRAYREAQIAQAGMRAHFPIWGRETGQLARDIVAAGTVAHVVSLDPSRLPARLAGARFDAGFLAGLPAGVDPCGEAGEFHTLASDGPVFRHAVPVALAGIATRAGHVHADFRLAPVG
jgi:uncharacterized protein (TIGR00290 family)